MNSYKTRLKDITTFIFDVDGVMTNGKIIYRHDGKIDRQFNHFKQKDSSYFYYYNQKIKEILEEIKPNIVCGESTAFHELLTILNCKRKDILYLNPSSCRYPKGRFSFYKYDTLTPFNGSGEILENTIAEKMISQIVNRNSSPDYMKLKPPSKISKINDKALKVKSYFFGEKYKTVYYLSIITRL